MGANNRPIPSRDIARSRRISGCSLDDLCERVAVPTVADWELTVTNTEMAQHAQLRIDTGLEIYFCDPQSPWQRGTNDNTNGLLRQYFPKGPNLSRHSRDGLDAVALHSTRDLARPSDERHPPRPSTSSYSRPDKAAHTVQFKAAFGLWLSARRWLGW
jgi:hypothetical protein